ncbi:MAG: hypothetical protein AAGD32_13380 [Planctomycetota bacterium]
MIRTLVAVVALLLTTAALAQQNPLDTRPANPLDRSGATTEAGWSTYQHPTGLIVAHPDTWTVQQTPEVLLLQPADARPEREMFVLSWLPQAMPLGTPQTLAAIDAQILQFAADARRTDTRPITTGLGPAQRLRYTGTGPTNQPGVVLVYYIPHENGVLMLVAGMSTDLEAQRAPVTDAIFQRLSVGERPAQQPLSDKVDPNLVGSYRTGTTFHDPGVGGSVDVYVHLRPDGSAVRNTNSTFYMQQKDDDGNITGGVDSIGQNNNQGQWTADGTTVTVRWDNGETLHARYKVFSNGVEVYLANGEKLLLEKVGG